ncbi:MAG: helix-hairpin-helix domain-containing protein [Clostridia bacterium]|nr:helix-hairpin-helix domain-containing protein [Clostridia bacterium]
MIAEGMININSASLEELIALPGIGETTARAILGLRLELGTFRIKEDLLLVKGIGEKKLEAIRELIYIR